jgi:histidinol-phosphate/aromatic aminotransferase/cobyric acid decarboxylase-like protein
VLDLSASLNPVATDPTAVLVRHLGAIGRYPDLTAATTALADAIGIEPTRLVLTNGGAEAIALVAAEVQRGWVDEPDFALYRRHLSVLDPAAGRWRSNPHNPTGLLAGPEETAAVWDEAFWPLATGTWTRGDANAGSIVVGSLTKVLACPGLRVGYVLCPGDELAGRLLHRQPQWALNGLAAAALPDLLDQVHLPAWAAAVGDLREALMTLFRTAGYEPRPSQANWVLVDAPRLRDELAAHAILVRDCASFGLPGTVRVGVPDAAGLGRLEAALACCGGGW